MYSKKYKKKLDLYKRYAENYPSTFSDEEALECYNWETSGKPINPENGFAVGKSRLDITLAMWKEDLSSGLLSKEEYEEYLAGLK